MRLVTLSVIPLIALAACATPREACIADANRQGRVINELVLQTRENIARGYAIETKTEFVEVEKACEVDNGDGTTSVVICKTFEPIEVQVPIAIDLNVEMAKLRSLEERQRQMQVQIDAAIQQCIAIHPE